ncbi:CD166 antigen homolog [Kryptolebias marmoratus]|uniref:CD166 antigen homolog n=1 Tax=Kryptolebias marmoratus TaxID=37003 RepID=A0A3Q2ZX59_KRYMA|nr:CD166 antigen homolog [Kryptolebias marmoratus]
MGRTQFLCAVLVAQTLFRVLETRSVTALFGETIEIPCNGGNPPPEDLMFVKWTYKRDDDTIGSLVIKQSDNDEATIQATDDYAQRISISETFSLLISQASLKDQKIFTCKLTSTLDSKEYSSSVIVIKVPSSVEIFDKSDVLQKDKLTIVGTCVASDSNPPVEMSWKKSGNLLVSDGKAVVITPSLKLNPASGLSTTSSTLQYAAAKEDVDAVFTCTATHNLTTKEIVLKPFPIHYPSEKASLQIMSEEPIVEGDNVTLRCHGDGSPPPSSFFFFLNGKRQFVENSDSYTLTFIRRDATGEYKCFLADDENIMDSKDIIVNYIDLTVNLTGKTVKKVGDHLSVKTEISTSGNFSVTWTKNGKTVKEPDFTNLIYADAGVYICKVSMARLTEKQGFELVVEGKPVITNLSKHSTDKHQVLTCEAEAVPEPRFKWSIEGIHEEQLNSSNNKIIHKITIDPKTNLTISCTVTNSHGEDVRNIVVYPGNSLNHTYLIVGVVVGTIVLAVVFLGICLWRKSRRGSWTAKRNENGTIEERQNLDTIPSI